MSESHRRHAIVTMLVGDAYVKEWDAHCRTNWLAYGKRHDCDIIVLTEPVLPGAVTPERSLHWQKLLVPSLPMLRQYESVAWLDGDILINSSHAPSIFDGYDATRIGAVDIWPKLCHPLDMMSVGTRWSYIAEAARRIASGEALPNPADYRGNGSPYSADELEPAPREFINTGVFLFNPERHAAFFQRVFHKYHRNSRNEDFEQTPLSFEIIVNGLAQFVDERFNVIWPLEVAHHYPFLFGSRFINPSLEDKKEWLWLVRQCVTTTFYNSYFLHFAGAPRTRLKNSMSVTETTAVNYYEFLFEGYTGTPSS